MPIVTIQSDAGQQVQIEVPDGATDDQILRFAKSQGLIGGQQPQEQQPTPQQDAQQSPGIPEQVAGGLSGAATLASDVIGTGVGGLTALVDILNPFTDNDPAKLIEDVKAKLRIDPSVGGEAALGQLAQAIEPARPLIDAVSQFKETAGQQGLDLTGSPAFATFVNIIPDIIAEVGGAGLGKRAATSVLPSPGARQTRRAAASAVEKVEEAEKVTGIRQLTTDVLPPETRAAKFMQQQGELISGAPRAAQQSERVRAVEKLVQKFDVDDVSSFEAGIVEGVKRSVNKQKAVAGELFEQSTAQLDKLGSVPLNKTKRFANSIIDAENKKGSLADQSLIGDMQAFVEAPDDLSFETIKSIRSSVGNKLQQAKQGAPVQGSSDVGKLSQTYKQLTGDMESFAEAADPALLNKWKKADKVYSDFATGADKSGVKSVIKRGDATPEVVNPLLFSGKKSDLDFLKANLDEAGKQSAKQRVLQRIMEQSTGADLELNPKGFQKGLAKHRAQIGAFFAPDERKAITSLREVLADTRRAQEAAVTTPTGQGVVPLIALLQPQVLVPGVVQTIIERPAMRNLLIKRKAAKTARQRLSIDTKLQQEIDKAGLLGATATGAAVQEINQQEQQ